MKENTVLSNIRRWFGGAAKVIAAVAAFALAGVAEAEWWEDFYSKSYTITDHWWRKGVLKEPKKGMYKYVTSANYLGEITEWLGFAILTWSFAGLLFFWFSCCNLIPRSNAIYKKYEEEFPDEFDRKKLKRIIPFIY